VKDLIKHLESNQTDRDYALPISERKEESKKARKQERKKERKKTNLITWSKTDNFFFYRFALKRKLIFP